MSVMEATELTISEAAESAGVTAHTLRYYERAGLLDEFAHHLQAIDFKIDLYEKGTIR